MRRFALVILVFLAFFGGVGPLFAAPEASGGLGAGAVVSGEEDDGARQLRIYKGALLNGSDEQTRVDAAVELLVRSDRESVAVLLETLASGENPPARQAVCRGLIKSRAWTDKIRSRKEFMAPLFGILIDHEGEDASLAAEALVIFEFAEVSSSLKRYARSIDLDRRVRLNVIYALKLWTDKEAISELLLLLDDKDDQVAAAAQKALQESFAIPEGTDREMVKGIVRDLQRKKPIEVIRDLMVVQRDRMAKQSETMRKVRAEADRWRQLYLEAIDREYEVVDDVGKTAILVDKLGSEFSAEKIWAMGKVLLYSGQVPGELRDRLVSLIADGDRSVRLETARVLLNMSALDPAVKLLERFEVEKDPAVALAIFEALGEACYYAFSAGSEIELDESVRDRTLRASRDYLATDDNDKSRVGGEVIGKLVALKDLDEGQSRAYLEMLSSRYERCDDDALREKLLGVMGRLCGANSSCRGIAGRLFGKIFRDGLDSEQAVAIRMAAAKGLINIDKTEAYKEFDKRHFSEDGQAAICKMVIELAGEVGKSSDLDWLVDKLDSNGESEPAWAAMQSILSRQRGAVAFDWSARLVQSGINGQRERTLLELAEKKASGEKDAKLLAAVRFRLMEVYLAGEDFVRTGDLIGRRLGEGDFKDDDELVVMVGVFLGSQEVGDEQKASLLKVLVAIEVDESAGRRPGWDGILGKWQPTAEQKDPAGKTPTNADDTTQTNTEKQPEKAEGN